MRLGQNGMYRAAGSRGNLELRMIRLIPDPEDSRNEDGTENLRSFALTVLIITGIHR